MNRNVILGFSADSVLEDCFTPSKLLFSNYYPIIDYSLGTKNTDKYYPETFVRGQNGILNIYKNHILNAVIFVKTHYYKNLK